MSEPLLVLAAVVAGVLGTARATRLWVDDSWPPVAALRQAYRARTPPQWHDLADCAFCAAPWVAAPNLAWAALSDLHWSWWVANTWLAVAYLAAILVVRDTPE